MADGRSGRSGRSRPPAKRPRHGVSEDALRLAEQLEPGRRLEGAKGGASKGGGAPDDGRVPRFDPQRPAMLVPELDEDEDEDLALDTARPATGRRDAVEVHEYDTDSSTGNARPEKEREEDEDMFADRPPDQKKLGDRPPDQKKLSLLTIDEIEGQEFVRDNLGENSSDDDDDDGDDGGDDDEAIDDEFGAGGKKKKPPKLEAFNMREDMEEGKFDETGNFIRNAPDPHAIHDQWLEGVKGRDIRLAREAKLREQAQHRERLRLEAENAPNTAGALANLIRVLKPAESPLEALVRLGQSRRKTWKERQQDKKKGTHNIECADGDKETIEQITEWTDSILNAGISDIYELPREGITRKWQTETGSQWCETENATLNDSDLLWEYMWPDRDELFSGYSTETMRAWAEMGYFGKNDVLVRRVGENIFMPIQEAGLLDV